MEIYNKESNIRIDNYLSKTIEKTSRTKIQKLIQNGMIKVDNYIVKSSFKLKGGETISISTQNIVNRSNPIIKQNIPLNIIFEDEYIIIINKSSGLVVHPGTGNPDGTLLNALMYHFKELSSIDNRRPGIVHRLDKYTSGLIVIAKTDDAHFSLGEQFALRKVKKTYRAIIWGHVEDQGKIEGMIDRDKNNRTLFKMDSNKGKYSLTNYMLFGF